MPSAVEAIHDTPSHLPSATANEPVTPQITTAPTMPEHLKRPQSQTAPPIKTPTAEDASRPASNMHTTVQLTFSFEVASVQLTPTFKVGILQVRPTSKVVTMRLVSGQAPAAGDEFGSHFRDCKDSAHRRSLWQYSDDSISTAETNRGRFAFVYG